MATFPGSALYVLSLFYLVQILLANALTLDSRDLLIGDWNVTLNCRNSFFSNELFPPRSAAGEIESFSSKWGFSKGYDCRLSVFSNGTFEMSPQENLDNTQESTSSILLLHGRWKLRRNPYCVTDRFYDELLLTSYPRIQRNATELLQKVQLTLQCRLHGHYTNGGLWKKLRGNRYARGRLSRGTVLWEQKDKKDEPWWKRKKIKASFSAARRIEDLKDMDDEEGISEED